MKLNWGTRKLTFVVIRDANESVVRFRLRSIFLYMIPVLIILAAVAIYLLSRLYIDSVNLNKQLETQLQAENIEHDTIVEEKDKTIEQLMSDVVELSTQTEQVREKLDELQQISDQIKSINGEPAAAIESDILFSQAEETRDVMIASASSASVSTSYPPYGWMEAGAYGMEAAEIFHGLLLDKSFPYDTENGQGGSFHDVTAEEILMLAEDSKASLKLLEERMGTLKIDLEEAKEIAIEYQHMLRITPSIWPTTSTRITSTFGYRKDPFTRRLSYHSGVDFGGKTGDPVYATAEGKVINSGYDRYLGYHIIIDHTNGLRTVYAHLSKRLVSVGDTVEKGAQIGKLGSTGRSTGPHLHYEVYKNGVPVNPKTYLP